MPLIIEGGRVPTRWLQERNSRPLISPDAARGEECVRLAFINNMPDAALEDTELQFFDLLDIASGDAVVRLKLYSLTGIPRTDRGYQHLNGFYFGLDELWNSPVDGIIVTGTEPRQPSLKDEPYWSSLTNVLDWAERNTISAVLSCLAAHASVLYSDGINRCPLPDKQFGVFDSARACDHPLTSRIAGRIRFPHSRWNEVRANELASCGYTVLTESAEAGVDLFVKKKKKSLFVHFQGHPEYGALTLLKEYRRDIKRFLGRERESFPTMPAGYFDPAATKLLKDFQEAGLSNRREETLTLFPEAALVQGLQNTWRPAATTVYRNWLEYVTSKKAETFSFAAMARAGRVRSTVASGERA
ncbi:MAG: homoserine O-succinyltransferase [Candidatus Sulfotelmatobacter sp.]|jgi:homoserine O-succinyltransferase